MSSQLLSLLHDPSTLVGLVLVTVFAVYYVLSRPRPRKSSIPLDNQSIELPVSCFRTKLKHVRLCFDSLPLPVGCRADICSFQEWEVDETLF